MLAADPRDGVVRRGEVVIARLGRAEDGALDASRRELCEQIVARDRPAEDRTPEEGESIRDQWTASSNRIALSANRACSSAADSPASLTFSTSIRGEQAGPSLA